jgi:large subunit ribosomal protein L6
MQNIKNKYSIKIPNHITVFYCERKRFLIIKGPLTQKSLKLKVKIELSKTKNLIRISSTPFNKLSKNARKKVSALQGTTTALIKQLILETSYNMHEKLKLVGVGYRALDVENYENTLLFLKLGYSHPIYIKVSNLLKFYCLKKTKLFIYGNSYQEITKSTSKIRSFKKPEPYKGKGILYDNEKIVLKEGKKI